MSRLLDGLSWLVTVRPRVTLAVLAAITVFLAAGIAFRPPQADSSVFLAEDSDVAVALGTIEERFGGAAQTVSATLLFRGEALTPDGLDQIDRAIQRVIEHPDISSVLSADAPVTSPNLVISRVLGHDNFADASQDEIDRALARIRQAPELAPTHAALDALVGTDIDGTTVALASIRLQGGGDQDRLARAEHLIDDLVGETPGPLSARSLSPTLIDKDAAAATGSTMTRLMGIALIVIGVITFLFTRSGGDLVLTMLSLILAIVWVLGVQGWLGPEALGLIGPPNTLTSMVPVMLIGLAVDYAIQTVALYREQRHGGQAVRVAVRAGLRRAIIPLALAAVTTMAGFLTNLASPIPANGDFGVTAGLGVAFGLIVMLTLIPAGRALIDRRQVARRRRPRIRPISSSLPGIGNIAGAIGRELAHRPAPYLALVVLVTVLLGIAATGIESTFDRRELLPTSGDSSKDLATLDYAFGGSTEDVSVLIEAEVTQSRTILNLLDFTDAFRDDLRRPRGVDGDIQASLGLVVLDWIGDSGEPGDKFDQELLDLFLAGSVGVRVDPAVAQEFLERLSERDPEAVSEVFVNEPDGIDTLLIRFSAWKGDQQRTATMLADINGLWFGADDEFTATSDAIVSLEIADTITEGQTQSIITTIVVALIILVVFFWITQGQPALGVIAVAPIALVLVWVLGTMALLEIPYNVVTALITALSIGIGVDYTIHVIHRYKEEYAEFRDPEAAAGRTLATTGSALLGSAVTTALGFGVLAFSPLTPFQQFGILTAITIVYALIAAILVVPPAMIVWGAYQNLRLRAAVERARTELDSQA